MENFTPLAAITGGILIGLSSLILLIFNGRIAGISGIIGQLFSRSLTIWPWLFLGGLSAGSWLAVQLGYPLPVAPAQPKAMLVIGGLLVGLGTSIGSGCTSGHGICGISRFSKRSFVSVAIFMLTAMLTVWMAGGVEHG